MQYIKKPSYVDAEQFFGANQSHPLPFAADAIVVPPGGCDCGSSCQFCRSYWVQTATGQVKLLDGDWVVRQAIPDPEAHDGRFFDVWVTKPHIFDRTYVKVSDPIASLDDHGVIALPLGDGGLVIDSTYYSRDQILEHNQRVAERRGSQLPFTPMPMIGERSQTDEAAGSPLSSPSLGTDAAPASESADSNPPASSESAPDGAQKGRTRSAKKV